MVNAQVRFKGPGIHYLARVHRAIKGVVIALSEERLHRLAIL